MEENLRLRQQVFQSDRHADYMERLSELSEARNMTGIGPWTIGPGTLQETDRLLAEASRRFKESDGGQRFRESDLPPQNGWWGEIDLILDTAEWRREINLSWLEFSRWGIQQIILVTRLYWLKNALIQRGVNVASAYVFGRGVEISSQDETANEILETFMERNKKVLGQIGLTQLERQKYTDGNLFFVFFADKIHTGEVNLRTIEATEMQEIICDPDDVDTPWFYRRQWNAQRFSMTQAQVGNEVTQAWYPALGYDPSEKPNEMRGFPVMWDNPVLHRRCGYVGKWHFGCPIAYAALDWAKTAKKYLEACYTTTQAHAQIAWDLTTKGGQKAIAGSKQQLETTVSSAPGMNIWDTNPTAVAGSILSHGPGTSMKPVATRGAGGNPSEVKEYRNMVAIVLGVPPTWLGDLETANLSTATTLDRPTELGFVAKQSEWQEDLTTIAKFVLAVNGGAAGGKLRESSKGSSIVIREAKRTYVNGKMLMRCATVPKAGVVEVAVNFPAIREGDAPALVKAIVEAMTLENKGGQVTGIDEKEGVKALYRVLDIENGDEIAEAQYPEGEYDPDRTKEVIPPPIPKLQPQGGVQPTPAQAGAATA